MKKTILFFILILLLASGCTSKVKPVSAEENVELSHMNNDSSLENRLVNISFYPKDDYYVRNISQNDREMIEVIAVQENSFMRIIDTEADKEVFSYNYIKDEFTYLYYFAEEITIKVVYDMTNQNVLDDEDEFFDLIKPEAIAFKDYFNLTFENANIAVDELW